MMQRICHTFIFLVTCIFFNYASDGFGQGGTEFCVANMNKIDLDKLLGGLNWACGPGGANCSAIQQGQPCYDSTNLAALASFAYNDYYQKSKATGGTCDFNGTAVLTNTDPSHGSCIYTGSTGAAGSKTNSTGGGGSSSFPSPPAALAPIGSSSVPRANFWIVFSNLLLIIPLILMSFLL